MSESLSIPIPASVARPSQPGAHPTPVIWIAAGTVDRRAAEPVLAGLGLSIRWTSGADEVLLELNERPGSICLLDCTRSAEALRIARTIRAEQPRSVLIGIVDASRPETTLDAFRAGVFDVLPWPIAPWDLSALIANAHDLAELVSQTPSERIEVSPYGVFGTSPAIRKIVELLPRVAPSRCPIVLFGERGTGREMLARAIHGNGRRADALFVSIDCSSATPQDIEDELFGCVSQRRAAGVEERRSIERVTTESKLYRASGGTLFLTNLSEMPTRVQAKLHRVLRDREVTISDERRRVELDIRPIAAVEPGFEAVVEEGRLRRDLFERLSLIRIELPPLRQRREDVPFLASYFLKEICRANGMPLKTLTRPGMTLLAALPWRGNAPELRALLERLVLLTPHGSIRLEDVLSHVRIDGSEVASAGGMSLRDARLRFERDYIAGVVRQHHGRMGEAAAALGIQRTNLYRKLRQLSVVRQGREPRR
jgi:two-component system, NtrC family, nitrogen regulation response regulator NtrX